MNFYEFKTICSNCTKCELHTSRTNIVIGRGNEKAPLLFVGEAPGENEDLQGVPFVGRAGKLLDSFLCDAGFSNDDYYITNILKCRPPQNRDPNPHEMEMCKDFLNMQIEMINPKMVVCLGRIAAMNLIDKHFKITSMHGKWYQKENYEICGIYHPSYLLRDPRKRPEMTEDLKIIRQKFLELQ